MKELKNADILRDYWQSFAQYPRINWLFAIIWLLLIAWVTFLGNLGSTGLVDETEPLFAEASRQMTVTGDWVTPYFNGNTRFDKPILIYWLMAICYKLIGVNSWAVRLPSAIAAIALMIFCFVTLRYFGFATPAAVSQDGSRTQRQLWLSAWIGSALVAFNLQTIIWAHQGVSDMLLSGCIGTALLCFFWGYAEEVKSKKVKGKSKKFFLPNRWYLGFYIFSALAVLTKGPVGIVLPGIIILAFLVYVGKFKEVCQEIGIIGGGFIFLLITLPWYILVTLKNGSSFINAFFGYHNFDRFTGVVNGHDAPWYFYFLVVFIGFIPWSIYLPLAITRIRFWQHKFWREQPRSAQLSLFAFFWFVVIFLFFTLATTKLPSYTLPLIPSAAILVSLIWSQELTNPYILSTDNSKIKANRGLLISGIFNVAILIILAVTFLIVPQLLDLGNDPAVLNLPELVEKSGLPVRGAIIWSITAIIVALLLKQKQQWRWLICVNLAGFFCFIIFVFEPTTFLLDQVRQLPLREISATLMKVHQPDEKILMLGFNKPSVVFYSQRQVQFLKNQSKVTTYLENNNLNSSTILIIGREKDFQKNNLQFQDYQILDQHGRYQLVRIDTDKFVNKVRIDN